MSRTLTGLTVLSTRDEGLARELRSLGAEVRVAEVLTYEAVPLEVDPRSFDWIVFTSRRAVAYSGLRLDSGPRIACVGSATAAAVREHGGRVDVVPDRQDAQALVKELLAAGVGEGTRVLFPASEQALSTIEDALCAAGAEVVRVTSYRPVRAASLPAGITVGVDAVLYLAPSAVTAFAELGGDLSLPAVAIGHSTAKALEARGITPRIAPTADRAGLIEALWKLKEGR